MFSSGKYLFNAGQTPQNDRENLQQAHSSKSNAEFGRMYLRPKQAFGDLQNVMHNTPLKGSLKPQAYTPSPFVSKKSTKVLPPVKKRVISNNEKPEDLDCAWLENSSMSVLEFKANLQRGVEKKKKQKDDQWRMLGEEILLIHKRKPDKEILDKFKSVDHLNDILTELCVEEPSKLCPPSIPDLPVDDFENDDFFKW